LLKLPVTINFSILIEIWNHDIMKLQIRCALNNQKEPVGGNRTGSFLFSLLV